MAIRAGGPAAGGRAADALGDPGRDVQGAERDRGRARQLPEPPARRADAARRVPARPPVRRALGRARPRRREAADRAVRDARSPDGRRLHRRGPKAAACGPILRRSRPRRSAPVPR